MPPSMHISKQNASERSIFPLVKILTKGPMMKKPSTSPVHLAQRGSCTPRMWRERSHSWWHRKTFLQKRMDFCQRKYPFSVIVRTHGYRTYIFWRFCFRFCLLRRKAIREGRIINSHSKHHLCWSFETLALSQNGCRRTHISDIWPCHFSADPEAVCSSCCDYIKMHRIYSKT